MRKCRPVRRRSCVRYRFNARLPLDDYETLVNEMSSQLGNRRSTVRLDELFNRNGAIKDVAIALASFLDLAGTVGVHGLDEDVADALISSDLLTAGFDVGL